jgi:hypothetical protein
MSTTPLLAAAPDNGIGAGANEMLKYPAPGDAAGKNTCARERLRGHELAVASGNRLGAGASEKLKYPAAAGDAAGKNTYAREQLSAHELAAASGNRLGAGENLNYPAAPDDTPEKKTWALTHEGRRARELAAAASALAEELRGSELDVFVGPAKSVAASAAAYAESLRDAKTASNLEFSIAEFNHLFNNTRPKKMSTSFDEFRRKSSMVLRQYRCRPRAGDGKPNPPAEPKHDAGDEKRNPPTEPKHDGAQDVSQALNVADVAAVLAVQLGREAPGSALATTAQAFAQEARKFVRNTDDRNARALFVLTGRALLGAAKDEPPQFAAAIQDILLSAAEALGADPAPPSNSSSRPQAQMPISDAVIGKRQVLYAMALAAPVSILTSAAGLQLFAGNWIWVAGAGVAVWILATGGMLLNQFGQMDWEEIAGRHLGRLGVLGAVVLMSFYAYRAFFPAFPSALIFLVGLALVTVGIPWILVSS